VTALTIARTATTAPVVAIVFMVAAAVTVAVSVTAPLTGPGPAMAAVAVLIPVATTILVATAFAVTTTRVKRSFGLLVDGVGGIWGLSVKRPHLHRHCGAGSERRVVDRGVGVGLPSLLAGPPKQGFRIRLYGTAYRYRFYKVYSYRKSKLWWTASRILEGTESAEKHQWRPQSTLRRSVPSPSCQLCAGPSPPSADS
jgi:hypothetical protein